MFVKFLILLPLSLFFLFFTILGQNFPKKELVAEGCFVQDINIKTLGEFDSTANVAFLGKDKISPLQVDLVAKLGKSGQVLATHVTPEGAEKWIEIDLSEQKIRAWEGNRQVMEFVISSGKRSTPTPVGEFRTWVKLRYTKMEGGVRGTADYYYLPNVPYVMYFNKGYGIHGAYWHMNFGTPVSHGCVNLQIADSGKLFNWAGPLLPSGKSVVYPTDDNPGTKVIVHE